MGRPRIIVEHSERNHALLAPSAADKWWVCPGQPFMVKDLPPRPPSHDMLLGTKAHELREKAKMMYHRDGWGSVDVMLDNHLDQEMANHVRGYLRFLSRMEGKFLEKRNAGQVFLEEKLVFTEECFGTLDDAIVASQIETGVRDAFICDFKYGKGVEVDAEDNLQLKLYSVFLENKVGNLDKIWCAIYQPRIPSEKPYKIWEFFKKPRHEFKAELLKKIPVILSMYKGKTKPKLVAGDHCRFCPANLERTCPEVKAAIKRDTLLDIESLEGIPLPAVVENRLTSAPVESLVKIYRNRKRIDHFLNAVDGKILALLISGDEEIQKHLKLVRGRSQRKWRSNLDTVSTGLIGLGLDPWKKSLINIGDAETQLGGGKAASEKIAPFVEKPLGNLQIASLDDKREKIDTKKEVLAQFQQELALTEPD